MGKAKYLLEVVFSYRFIVATLVMLCTFIQYCQKVDLSVNIVCMVNQTAVSSSQNNTQCPETNKTVVEYGTYTWTSDQQGLLLSAFFWGYAISQIPGGFISSKFGSKLTMLCSMITNGIIQCLYPTLSQFGFQLMIILRLLIGLSAGFIFPSLTQLWSRWAPIQDRSLLIGLAISGSHLGSVFTLPIGGYLCANGFAGGWPSLFYVIAIMSFTWATCWLILFRDDPQNHPFVSSREKQYILRNTVPKKPLEFKQIPWFRILKSRAFIAHTIYHTLVNWGFYILLTMTPTYMKQVLCFDIKENGAISALPFLMIWLSTTISGVVADYLIGGQIMTRTAVRKLANSIGAFGPAIFTLALGFVPRGQPATAVALLTIAELLFGITFGAGFMCVCNDIGGSIAGIVFGMANCIGSIPGIIAPTVTSAMTPNGTSAEWRVVFIVAAVIYAIAGTEFLIMGTALPQSYMEVEQLKEGFEDIKKTKEELEVNDKPDALSGS